MAEASGIRVLTREQYRRREVMVKPLGMENCGFVGWGVWMAVGWGFLAVWQSLGLFAAVRVG